MVKENDSRQAKVLDNIIRERKKAGHVNFVPATAREQQKSTLESRERSPFDLNSKAGRPNTSANNFNRGQRNNPQLN